MSSFVWDSEKELFNIHKHGVDFATASKAFLDPKRKIYAMFIYNGVCYPFLNILSQQIPLALEAKRKKESAF